MLRGNAAAAARKCCSAGRCNIHYCTQGIHHANWSFAAPCAVKHGVDLAPVNACFNDVAVRDALWQARLADPYRWAPPTRCVHCSLRLERLSKLAGGKEFSPRKYSAILL